MSDERRDLSTGERIWSGITGILSIAVGIPFGAGAIKSAIDGKEHWTQEGVIDPYPDGFMDPPKDR